MGGGTDAGGYPRTMNQREHQHFYKNCCVIRMTNITERAGGYDSHAGGVHHLDVPMFTKSTNYPPADNIGKKKNREANGGENGIKRAMKEYYFKGGTHQYSSMQQDHRAKDWIHDPGSAVSHHFALVPAGDLQFVNAQQRYDKEKAEVGFDT
jgi:hypothetical protein